MRFRMADCCSFPPAEFSRLCPANWLGITASCDYDVRHNLTGEYAYQLPLKVRGRDLGYALNGWQVSGTVVWHSG